MVQLVLKVIKAFKLEELAKIAVEKELRSCFDRGGYLYHGRVKLSRRRP